MNFHTFSLDLHARSGSASAPCRRLRDCAGTAAALHSGETEHEAVLVSIYADWRLVLRQLWRRHRPAASSSRHDDRRTSLFGSASSGESRINGGAEMDYWIAIARVIAKATAHRPRVLSLISALTAALPWFMPGVAWSDDLSSAPARTPFGVYAHIDFESMLPEMVKRFPSIQISQTATQSCAVVATSPNDLAALHIALQNFYTTLLSDGAVSGITMGMHWCRMQVQEPNKANSVCSVVSGEQPCYPDGNDWSYLDDLFTAVHEYNATNEAAKTIQLIVTPGVYSPSWLTDGSILKSCDPLFEGTMSIPDCGMVTFDGYSEEHDSNVLPLPWNAVYKSAWRTFLEALAARYGSRSTFVSIAVAGPTAATAEMSLPSTDNTKEQKQFSGGNISPDKMWLQLLRFHYTPPSYQGTDLAFIDEWEAAIDMYGQVFSGLTLVATTDSGLPSFSDGSPTAPGFGADCSTPTTMACAAVTTILAYFAQPSTAVANAKATQTSGFEASRAQRNLGVPGVKLLSQMTENLPPPSEILGGTQFNTSFAEFPVTQGCVSAFPPYLNNLPPGCSKQDAEVKPNSAVPAVCVPASCFAGGSYPPTLPTTTPFRKIPKGDLIPPEQALYNLLHIYFNKTVAAAQFGGTPGLTPAPLNYLQIYSQDIVYATNHDQAPVPVIENGQPSPVSLTAQSMLELASQLLFQIAEPPNN